MKQLQRRSVRGCIFVAGIVALVVGWRRLPAVPGHPIERPDPAGVVFVTAGVGLLTFGLVTGSEWGWASPRTVLVLGAAAVGLAAFAWRCWRARNPLVQPELFRSREFTVASIVAIFFSAAFGAMLLSIVLWEQDAWGWSALRAGLAIAPGPGTAAALLPPNAFATGSAVINMIRQAGLALGVALLVTVLGTSAAHGRAGLASVERGWWLIAALSFAGIVPAVTLGRSGVGQGQVPGQAPGQLGTSVSISAPPTNGSGAR